MKKVSLHKEDLNSFRPITNLALFESNVIESPDIFRLLPSNCFNWKMTTLHFDIVKATDNKSDVIQVLLDLSAVFDTIDHDFLVTLTTNSVWLYGHRSLVVRVVHPESFSEGSNCLHGIPQGSVLGPPLFILYIASLENVIKSHELDCMICADASQLHIIVNPDRRHKAFAKHCISDIFGHFS